MGRACVAAVAAFLVVVGMVAFAQPRESRFPDVMVGAWSGNAEIFVNWTTARMLPVRVQIAPDGKVTGTIGDAVLQDGSLRRNRTAFGRLLHIKTDWAVVGDLRGDVIKAEGIHRDSVTLPLNWVGDHFEGGVNTSGSHFGGRESMWLAAGRLRLLAEPRSGRA